MKRKNIQKFCAAALVLQMGFAGSLWGQEVEEVKVQPNQQMESLIEKVTGKVVSKRTGEPLEGLSIAYQDLSATFTNSNGEFELMVPAYTTTIQVNFGDQLVKEIPLKGRSQLDIALSDLELAAAGSGYVQLPYEEAAQRHVTNAVTSVDYTAAAKLKASSPETFAQGTAAGVNTIRRSGTPGMGADMFIRGLGSLNASTQPLVVVDGMIYDLDAYQGSILNGYRSNPLSFLDVKDIDNITYIKDGGSIYGTKGANGVVLITTSRAKDLTTRIDFHTYGGVNIKPKNLPVMEADEFKPYYSEMLESSGLTTNEVIGNRYLNETPDTLGYYNYHNNTNWQDQVMKTSYDQNYYIKVSGGDNIARYALSLGHLKSNSIMEGEDMSRSSVRFNADFQITEKLTAGTNMSFSYAVNNLHEYGYGAEAVSPLYLGLVKSPFLAPNIYSDEGIQSPNLSDVDSLGISNPRSIVENMSGQNRRYRFFGSYDAKYQFNEHFSLQTLFGLTIDKNRESFFIPDLGTDETEGPNAEIRNQIGGQVQRQFSTYSDTRFDYSKTFGFAHDLDVGLGFRYNKNQIQEDRGYAYNSGTDDLITLNSGVVTLNDARASAGDWIWMSYYADIDYSYLDKYFVDVDVAVDGSSRFGKETADGIGLFNHRFGVFPSIKGAWLISSEDFMSEVNLDLLKLRLSYSQTGNDGIGNYKYLQTYSGSSMLALQGLVRNNLANEEIQWETNSKLNAGIDIVSPNSIFGLSVDLYQNTISNMLTLQPLEAFTGMEYYLANGGEMVNTGVDLGLSARVLDRDVKLTLAAQVGTYKNEVKQLPYDQRITPVAGGEVITQVGESASMFYGYQTEGVYSTSEEASTAGLMTTLPDGTLGAFGAGDVKFVDQNNDNVIDENDRTIIGDPNPDFYGGFSAHAEYKRFTFDAAFSFSVGNDVYNYVRHELESMSGYENQLVSVRNRWRSEGQETNMPRLAYGDPMGNSRFSDRWVEDGSYLRLKTLSVNYTIPIDGDIVKNIDVYASGQNLLTITNYLGYDPEFSYTSSVFGQGVDVGLTPQFTSVMLGLKIGL
ncbi:SusC/RagA family TonB-linked outer membrane protein [Echinicola strongylocentroti]|uniref:SusC/RagA family TonB-linked outer membrane protein n=1 Tax=Echinicola strongylocentroti TaxID=1795355 RepID=A0A2Z4IKV4_9BACT|nr:SusC/RagA family TonB-linked outer membrane protein [Echinicola strongylocentroti]AWW31186.1 SusC/RagA family TonB-linked outer membrane protein [Echinicola strongylocentroti]